MEVVYSTFHLLQHCEADLKKLLRLSACIPGNSVLRSPSVECSPLECLPLQSSQMVRGK